MKRFAIVFSLILLQLIFTTTISQAQLSAPNVESVYGGRINAIAGYALGADSSRIFIATESANSVFYADVFANGTPPVFSPFTVMPGLDAAAGYGPQIRDMAAHEASGMLLFTHMNGILSSHPFSSAVNTVVSGPVQTMCLQDSHLLFLNGSEMNFGALDGDANFTADANSPIFVPDSLHGNLKLFIHPLDSLVYIFAANETPLLFKTLDLYTALTDSTQFEEISLSSLSTSVQWRAFGIGPDGRLFLGGSGPGKKYCAYSDNDSTWTEYETAMGGIAGDILDFSGDSTSYHVYFASGYNSAKGEQGNWQSFGTPGGWETHPNDGAVFTDPVNPAIVYMTTDQGIGASTDHGATIFEIDDGVEAVQVNDLDMTADKRIAWIASKSGIRKVTNYRTSPLWTGAIFPNNDGSPYYSVAMVPGDTSSVYVGNVRVYKTNDDGQHWTQLFSTDFAPFNAFGPGVQISALEVCAYDTNFVFAGLRNFGPGYGGLVYSRDAGQTWDQILIEAGSSGQDVDVNDIVFAIEGADTVAYVGVDYDLSSPQGWSVYKLTKNGAGWSVAQDMTGSTTSTGSSIVVTITDVDVSTSGDTLFACGTDAGTNHPVAYYKPVTATGQWTPFTTSGFPMNGNTASAITIGRDTVYCAVDSDIYFLPVGQTAWTLGYAYPVGQRINFLYFDELLVGTETGLYGHLGTGVTTNIDDKPVLPRALTLHQNYPNPFNPSTVIRYHLQSDANATLKVYDLLGREVATLVDGFVTAGTHAVNFNASLLPNGVYFYRIIAGKFKETRKMLLVR